MSAGKLILGIILILVGLIVLWWGWSYVASGMGLAGTETGAVSGGLVTMGILILLVGFVFVMIGILCIVKRKKY